MSARTSEDAAPQTPKNSPATPKHDPPAIKLPSRPESRLDRAHSVVENAKIKRNNAEAAAPVLFGRMNKVEATEIDRIKRQVQLVIQDE